MQFQSHAASRYRLSALAGKSRKKSRMPRLLLGSVAMAAILLVGLALLGHWQAEASGATVQRQAPPAAAYRSSDPSVPAASEVLTDRTSEQADHVPTF
ncbi:hypothetical protein [Variovorax sp. MHTC-1]|uniref:hypothetical protein n=1 Tax=Variovorax sp. MHTC-1 TaxID=2495593 RepID=UPI000F866271|nr:hypothetical protein [Variovorax sp. MHTC-1]RST55889.1 hypothetical protein EJI01_03755 [Variovorax sp. MHTC-1]